MKLKDILKNKGSKVWTVKDSDTISDALEILVKHNIGAAVVCDDYENIVGILSERDIIRACLYNSKELGITLVRKLMTKNVITASPEDETNQIMRIMTDNRVRHIPVFAAKKLIGIVSIGDVVKSLLEDSEDQIQQLKEYLYGSL